MSDIPDIAGRDVKSWSQMHAEAEAANAEKVQRLMRIGMTEEVLASNALVVRLEALVSVMPSGIRQEFELRYERALGEVLDQVWEANTSRKIYKPGEG